MNIAIITAAGRGTRAKLSTPKQFYLIDGKPLLFYTIAAFERCKAIDGIVVVLPDNQLNYFEELKQKYGFNKLWAACPGGETNELSIYHGLLKAREFADDDTIVVIHDGVRCLVQPSVIEENIEVCEQKGNAITAIPCNEAMLFSEDGTQSAKSIKREFIYKTQTPHSIRLKAALDLFKKSIDNGNQNSVALCTLLIENNQKVYFSRGKALKFKVTAPEDIILFKSVLHTEYVNEDSK